MNRLHYYLFSIQIRSPLHHHFRWLESEEKGLNYFPLKHTKPVDIDYRLPFAYAEEERLFREGFRQCILEFGGGSGEWGWGGGQKHMPLLWGPAKPLFLTSGDRTGLFMSVHPSIYARTKRESICSWILPKYKRLSLSLYCLRLRVCGLPSMSFFFTLENGVLFPSARF